MIFAFDPGVSTGIAVIDNDGEVSKTFVARALNEVEGIAGALAEVHQSNGYQVVIERGPQDSGNYRYYIEQVERILDNLFPDATYIQPARWKNTPASRIDLPGKTQHEKDAARMGKWFYTETTHASS